MLYHQVLQLILLPHSAFFPLFFSQRQIIWGIQILNIFYHLSALHFLGMRECEIREALLNSHFTSPERNIVNTGLTCSPVTKVVHFLSGIFTRLLAYLFPFLFQTPGKQGKNIELWQYVEWNTHYPSIERWLWLLTFWIFALLKYFSYCPLLFRQITCLNAVKFVVQENSIYFITYNTIHMIFC